MNSVVILAAATVAFVGAEVFVGNKIQTVAENNPQIPAKIKKSLGWLIPSMLAIDLVAFGVIVSFLI